jgi:hypothetical protein
MCIISYYNDLKDYILPEIYKEFRGTRLTHGIIAKLKLRIQTELYFRIESGGGHNTDYSIPLPEINISPSGDIQVNPLSLFKNFPLKEQDILKDYILQEQTCLRKVELC